MYDYALGLAHLSGACASAPRQIRGRVRRLSSWSKQRDRTPCRCCPCRCKTNWGSCDCAAALDGAEAREAALWEQMGAIMDVGLLGEAAAAIDAGESDGEGEGDELTV